MQATETDKSLSELYTGASKVNHLFIESTYEQSGYFVYDSTQNFATLKEDGNFKVYNQIGTIERTGTSLDHGQFMPYNDLTPGVFSERYTNQTDVLDQRLPDTDPRKGEKLYAFPWDRNKPEGENNNANYHYAMDMSASFTQTADGLDAWGHDIIFKFSGDDDFWFYVDDELVLDLGGIHAAMWGTINFRTGEVKSKRGNSTLYDLFKQNYEGRGLTEDQVNAKLAEIFRLNEAGQYVFKNYTNHTMRMFYMERGGGASNLKMRFNLASVKAGTVQLSKELSGTESASNKLIAYPYQIWYRTLETETDAEGNPVHDEHDNIKTYTSEPKLLEYDGNHPYVNVVYKDSARRLPYQEHYQGASGATYDWVYFLKPGETAEINFPENTVDYKIIECDVDTGIYDSVKVNGQESPATQVYEGKGRSDYGITYDETKDRPTVIYNNHVNSDAVRTMSISKKLYDSDGQTELHYPDNDTVFSFRLYLGSETEDPNALPLANMYEYHVRDRNGNFCRWDAANQKFQSLGKNNFENLTKDEKTASTFTTSMNGSISKIPADYTVELHDLIAGVQFKLEERENEIPRGYTLRLEDGYQRTDEGNIINTHTTPITGTIEKNEDPEILVSNQKGWGLTVNKVWTDKDFMEAHDPIYFAVYQTDQAGNLSADAVPVEGTVRQMTTDQSSVYYFFGQLQAGIPFDRYVIREVNVVPKNGAGEITVDSSGYVTNEADAITVTPIEPNGTLRINGKPVGGTWSTDNNFQYTVTYQPGQQTTQNENVRTDTVTNSRPGIELYKQDWNDHAMKDAVFTLQDAHGNDVAAPSFTSGSDGKITIAYLNPGAYTLKETGTPKGYVGMQEALTITVKQDNTIEVEGGSGLYEVTHNNAAMAATITIKNRPARLEAKKIDPSKNQALAGVHFALYRQVTDSSGHKTKDYNPINGYEDLITDEHGYLPKIDNDLNPGTYYLVETQALPEYALPEEDFCFTINGDRTVTVESGTGSVERNVSDSQEEAGTVIFTLIIPNGEIQGVELPASGGPGTTWMYLLGTGLLLGCGILLIARRRIRRVAE